MIPETVYTITIHFASTYDLATAVCFLDFQDTKDLPMTMQKTDIDRLKSRHEELAKTSSTGSLEELRKRPRHP